MNWEEIKKRVYFEDGSLRDIYIRNASFDDWKKWVNHVNAFYNVDFQVEGTSRATKIDFNAIAANWRHESQDTLSAAIRLGKIIVMTYFFQQTEIENDITPKEIESFEDHNALIEFLTDISNLLNKPVELTEESYGDACKVLMVVDGLHITFPK